MRRLPEFHAQIIDYPPLQAVQYLSWRDEQIRFTGPYIPYSVVEKLPELLHGLVCGTPTWKVMLVLVFWTLLLFVMIFWSRLVSRLGAERSAVWGLALRLTTPLVLSMFATAMHGFMRTQINLSGSFAEAMDLWATGLVYIGLAWVAWLAVFLAFETIIALPAIPDDSHDAHLLRLLARVGSLLASVAVPVWGASDLGIPALGLVAGLGVGGFAHALAAQSTVENLFGGVSIFADRPFRVGDIILYGGSTGIVGAIGPRSSRIRGLDGTLTTVPSGALAKMHITNYSTRDKCLFRQVIGLGYETSPAQFEWLLAQIRKHVSAHPLVEEDEAGMPRARILGFADSAIEVEVRANVMASNWEESTGVPAPRAEGGTNGVGGGHRPCSCGSDGDNRCLHWLRRGFSIHPQSRLATARGSARSRTVSQSPPERAALSLQGYMLSCQDIHRKVSTCRDAAACTAHATHAGDGVSPRLAPGGRPAQALAGRLMLPVSKDTFLRNVREATEDPAVTPRVVSIDDDWVWRKGRVTLRCRS
ncbi:mechanosensitive ion channel family protein [Qingshengfaniella alkalisoli]|uniref:Small-conductance mechanosensitive channel n=1 Tax=Qingshengfaniella alkalisoli TaxID=2599296 RepID=A0A5B8I8P1_9RHOB|nr:mechanosensitive ion channel domain-containing protein [Qingshengfaniella alkalisoli]QDY70425.1 mechanosensitive ion channel [Qingshengfaniella alkalisoli]